MSKTLSPQMLEMRRLAGMDIDAVPPHTVFPGLGEQVIDESRLEEGKVTVYKDWKKTQEALTRARNLVQRVMATVQQDERRYKRSQGEASDKFRSEVYRLDQELQTAVECLFAAEEAFNGVSRNISADRREKRDQRDQPPARKQSQRPAA